MRFEVTDKLSDTMAVIVNRKLFPQYKLALVRYKDLVLPLCVLPGNHPDIRVRLDENTMLLTAKILRELNCSINDLDIKFVSWGLFTYGTLLPKWISPNGYVGECWSDELRESPYVRAILLDHKLVYSDHLPYALPFDGKRMLGVVYLGVSSSTISELDGIETGAGYDVSQALVNIEENYPMRRKINVRFYVSRGMKYGREVFTMFYGDIFYTRNDVKWFNYDSRGYFVSLEGNSPIILTAPHGGYWRPINYPPVRNRESDEETYELVREITVDIYELSGRSIVPYVMLARLHRSRVDFNRRHEVIRSVIARQYHDTIQRFLTMNKKAILLDIHGMHESNEYDIELGTNKGETVRGAGDFLETFHRELMRQGFSVAIDEKYTGEYTVKNYGASKNVIAIQIEINKRLRRILNYRETAKKIATAIMGTLNMLGSSVRFKDSDT